MKLRKWRLLRGAFEGGQVFVYRTVESLELLFWQGLLVLVANVDARFLKSVDEGRISPDIGHGVHENVAYFSVGGLWLHFAGFLRDPVS
jgi:hypothetical protein